MKHRSYVIILIALVSVVILALIQPREVVANTCRADLDKDGVPEVLKLSGGDGTYAQYLTIHSGSNEIYRIDLTEIKPWKVQTADVDGDGRLEISIGVYKTTRADHNMRKRPFLYSWDGKGLQPKWLGSRLSRPFEDYIFSDIDDDGLDELIAMEYLSDGQMLLCAYKWKGFGFEGIGESPTYSGIKHLTINMTENAQLEADILENNKWHHAVYRYRNDALIPLN